MQSPTNIEIAMREALLKRQWLFLEQYAIDRMVVDFALPLFWLVVECDGAYWHNLPRAQERDARKDIALTKLGWHVLRFTDAEIKQDMDICIDTITKAISGIQV